MTRKELYIDEQEEMFGIEAISLVMFPAIEENFVFFNKDQYVLAKVDEDRQMLVGPALIPNKDILRLDEDGNEYNVFFTPETVQKAAHLFMRQSKTNAATVDHERETDQVYVYESWVVENRKKDKQQVYGFDFPEGTWMVAMRVDDTELWHGVKEGKYRGFSIEGWFVDRIVSKPKSEEMEILSKIRELLAEDKTQLFAEDVLADGTRIVTEAESFAPGVKVAVLDEEGNPQPAPEGEHTLQNGSVLVVDAEGVLVEIKAPEAPEAEEVVEVEAGKHAFQITPEMVDEIKAIVRAVIAEDKAGEAEAAKESAEEAIEEVPAPVAEAITEMAKAVKEQFATISDRVAKLEDAPAAEKFSHTPAPKKVNSKPLAEMTTSERAAFYISNR